jgi:anti-sigma regulatory factor (Ser/Thr protein kinase)
MQPDRPVPVDSRETQPGAATRGVSEIDRLQATCRRQALALDKQGNVIALLRMGGRALKAENADLRSENARLRTEQAPPAPSEDARAELVESELAPDVDAARAARMLVANCLGGRVTPRVLANAQLLISELVANSVRHSAVAGDALVVRVAVEAALCRIEVEDSGCAGEIAPRTPDVRNGGGLGLQIVQQLSERWGLERAAGGGTRVWAYLRRTPLSAQPGDAETEGVRRVATAM